MRAIVLFFLLTGMLTIQLCVQAKSQKLNVLSTIKPVQALVMAITQDKENNVVDLSQLIPDFASPHFYTFKPSDLRRIKRADLIFRIDESMEIMLNPAFENASNHSKIISLADAQGVKLIPAFQKHASHASDKSSHTSKDGHKQELDMHIWTSPHNAIAMAKKIAEVLATADPENKAIYDANLQRLTNKIEVAAENIVSQLKTVKNTPYIVFHDSWQYFSQYYSLHKPMLVSFHEEIAPGARTLPKIRKQIKSENIHCIFTKPGMNPAWIETLTENLKNVKVVEIDVIASQLPMNNEMYIDWLAHMGSQIQSCLATD